MQQNNIQKKANGLGWLFFSMIMIYLVMNFSVGALSQAGIQLSVVGSLIFSEALILVPTLIYVIKNKCSFRDDLAFRRMKVGTFFLSIFLGFLVMPIASFVNVLSQFFVQNTMTAASDQLIGGQSFPIILFLSGVFAPVCEEFAFRSVFFERFGKLATPLKAAVCSALFFGLMHLNLNQACYAFVLGILFAVANKASGSVYTSMIMHIVINSFNMCMMYVSMSLLENADVSLADAAEQARTSDTLYMLAGVYLVLAFVCIIIYMLIVSAIAKHEGRIDELKAMFIRKNSAEIADEQKAATEEASNAEESEEAADVLETVYDSEDSPKNKQVRILCNGPALFTVAICLFIIFGLTPLMEMLGWM